MSSDQWKEKHRYGHRGTWAPGQSEVRAKVKLEVITPSGKNTDPLIHFFSSFWKNIGLTLLLHSDPPWDRINNEPFAQFKGKVMTYPDPTPVGTELLQFPLFSLTQRPCLCGLFTRLCTREAASRQTRSAPGRPGCLTEHGESRKCFKKAWQNANVTPTYAQEQGVLGWNIISRWCDTIDWYSYSNTELKSDTVN